ncbi:transmembrane and ubiquitin-like domain-containing protein 1 [Stegodyphus dumicola]|uniref:transmembrane and ubiquitin-like domain-containing protein 1 n=1 Tax=Stegodyphus dumicola TaxID=202533 RepID=UPI0015A946FC|nr:transmembrane and ubiquitin-like domain-containing protein 1 [Stegodyphus dumicola]XP_035219222.1 transmembrane and ubiquitin-like domain-containing protein 1 [Stegodyphus dumicola]
MSFIEGVGDEVVGFAVTLLILVLCAIVHFFRNANPWFIRDIPAVSPEVTAAASEQNTNESESGNEESSQENDITEVNIATEMTASTANHVSEVTRDKSEQGTDTEDKNTEKQSSSENTETAGIYPDLPCSDLPSAPPEEISTETASSESREIRIRLKYLDDTERIVRSDPTVQIGDFKRTHFPGDLASNKIVRLIFSGQLLRDNLTLHHYGIQDRCVIHVQVLQEQAQSNSPISQNTDLDLSHLLWPLISIILGVCWVMYFKYPDFFNVMSLSLLFLFTGGFVYVYSHVQ